jgi:DNA-binding CsgD family transcriptional regulator
MGRQQGFRFNGDQIGGFNGGDSTLESHHEHDRRRAGFFPRGSAADRRGTPHHRAGVQRPNKEVACQMDTSEQVIKNRMRDIYGKIGANRRGELISRVLRFAYEGT